MRKQAEVEKVVTAWRVVKRRMAKGTEGERVGRRTSGGRNGIRVEDRLRECRRGLRERGGEGGRDEHGWGDEFADQAK